MRIWTWLVAFRDGALVDSEVIAKQIIPMQMLLCASPEYLARNGTPMDVDDLLKHASIGQRLPNGRLQSWDFRVDGRTSSVTPHSRLVFNDPELVVRAAQDGRGLAYLPAYQVNDALRNGTLVSCLDAFSQDG